MKRILVWMLSIITVLSLLPVTTFAADEDVTIGDITSGSWTPVSPDDSSVATTGEWTAEGNYNISWYSASDADKAVTLTTAAQLAGLAVITNGLNGQSKTDFEAGHLPLEMTLIFPEKHGHRSAIRLILLLTEPLTVEITP